MALFLQYLMNGFLVGGVYALVALAFVLVFKSTGVFNLAQGELVMIGALTCWSFVEIFHLPILLAVLITLLLGALVGFLMERSTLRHLIGESVLSMVMVTIALSLLLSGVSILLWGKLQYGILELFAGGTLDLSSIVISMPLLWSFVSAIILGIGLLVYFQRTKSGLAMRAIAEDHQMAQATGVSVKQYNSLTWAIGASVSVIAGVLLASQVGVNLYLSNVGLKALPVALLGGLDSLHGALIAGIIVGVLETLAAAYLDPLLGGGTREVMPFIILILVLTTRPYGLFGLARIERI